MITSKQYDELTELLGKYRDAVGYVHTAEPEDRIDAAYDFAEADKAIEAYVLALVDFDGIAKERAAEDDGWIEWRGGECPIPDRTPVEVKFRNGKTNPNHNAEAWGWQSCPELPMDHDIVAYRIVRN